MPPDCEQARMYYHYAFDEMGSVTHVLDCGGKVLNRYGYDAFCINFNER